MRRAAAHVHSSSDRGGGGQLLMAVPFLGLAASARPGAQAGGRALLMEVARVDDLPCAGKDMACCALWPRVGPPHLKFWTMTSWMWPCRSWEARMARRALSLSARVSPMPTSTPARPRPRGVRRAQRQLGAGAPPLSNPHKTAHLW